jgi:CMP-N-acetylneuraminic acid synthetase
MELKSFAVIPARGGSKGLPNKNLKLLHGKPLITYTIEAALESKNIDEVIISTESEEISNISSKYGISIFERPIELASDTASIIDVVLHVLERMREVRNHPEIITLLQPTSPLRSSKDIDTAIELFRTKDCTSVVSVNELTHSPYWSFAIENQYMIPLFDRKFFKMRRQDLPKIYSANGAIYISTPQLIIDNHGFYSAKMAPYIMPSERSIDIDTLIDFKLAELIMREKFEDLSK